MRYASINFGKKVRRKLLLVLPSLALVIFAVCQSGGDSPQLSCSPKREVDIVSRCDLSTVPDPVPSVSDTVSKGDAEQETISQTDAESTQPSSEQSTPTTAPQAENEPDLPAYASLERISVSETLARPLDKGSITSLFGYRKNPVSGKYTFHSGLDLASPQGSNIYAILRGTVVFAGYESGYGNYIIVDHGGGLASLYAHCSKLIAQVGDKVEKGEIIALVGSTGNSTGPHLHIELRKNNKRCDPYELIGGMYV